MGILRFKKNLNRGSLRSKYYKSKAREVVQRMGNTHQFPLSHNNCNILFFESQFDQSLKLNLIKL